MDQGTSREISGVLLATRLRGVFDQPGAYSEFDRVYPEPGNASSQNQFPRGVSETLPELWDRDRRTVRVGLTGQRYGGRIARREKLWVRGSRKRGGLMQPLQGWCFKLRFFPQGGASLTLGCDMEPLRGSIEQPLLSQGGASLTLDFVREPLRGSSMKTGGAFSQGGASLTLGCDMEPFQGSRLFSSI